MITKLEINGFKTFENFKITLSPLVVIAGANGAGKSNLFDALQLLSRLVESDLKTAFGEQRGDARELFTQYPDGSYAKSMRFIVEMLVDRQVKDNWGEQKTLDYTRLRYTLEIRRGIDKRGLERLYIHDEALMPIFPATDEWYQHYVTHPHWQSAAEKDSNITFINTEFDSNNHPLSIILQPENGVSQIRKYHAAEVEQTILSSVNNTTLPHVFAVRGEMQHWKFLQLNPSELRKPSTIFAKEFMNRDGSNLPTALARIKADDPFFIKDLSREINNILPNIVSIDIEKDNNFDQYMLVSNSSNGTRFSSKVLSEGLLRLIALCALKLDDQHQGVLCLEEPENGIHPFKLESITFLLHDLATNLNAPDETEFPLRQLIVNTHSPVLVGHFFKHAKHSLTVFYATLFSRIHSGKTLNLTKMIPVLPAKPHEADITEPESKITLSELQRFLTTKEFNQELVFSK
jgi:predicted ATPase